MGTLTRRKCLVVSVVFVELCNQTQSLRKLLAAILLSWFVRQFSYWFLLNMTNLKLFFFHRKHHGPNMPNSWFLYRFPWYLNLIPFQTVSRISLSNFLSTVFLLSSYNIQKITSVALKRIPEEHNMLKVAVLFLSSTYSDGTHYNTSNFFASVRNSIDRVPLGNNNSTRKPPCLFPLLQTFSPKMPKRF